MLTMRWGFFSSVKIQHFYLRFELYDDEQKNSVFVVEKLVLKKNISTPRKKVGHWTKSW